MLMVMVIALPFLLSAVGSAKAHGFYFTTCEVSDFPVHPPHNYYTIPYKV